MKNNTSKTSQSRNLQNIPLSIFAIFHSRSTYTHSKYLLLSTISLLIVCIITLSCTFFASPLIACITLAALVFLWLTTLHPCLAVFLVFLCAGIPSLQIHLPGHTIRPVELSLLLCAIMVLFSHYRIRLTIPHVLSLLFLAVALISFIHVPEINTNTTIFGANKRLYNIFTILTALFCGTILINYISNTSLLLTGILISNIPIYLTSLAQAFGISLPSFLSSNQNPALTGDKGRLAGPFDGAATFGMYLTGLFAVSLSCALLGTCRRDRLIGKFMVFATSLSLVWSGTRSAVIATLIMLFLGLVITSRFKLFLGFAAVIITVLVTFPSSILSHFVHADTSTSNRLFLWKEAIHIIIAHPLIGIGLEQFHYFYSNLIVSPATQLNPHGISIHNQYLEWGVEGGILWLTLGVTFLLSLVIFCGYNYPTANHKQRLPLFAALLATIATMTTSFLDVPFDDVEGGVFLCMLAGLALGSVIYSSSLKNAY